MNDRIDPYDRYYNNPKFHMLVDVLAHEIRSGRFEPEDLELAARLAKEKVKHEEQNRIDSYGG